MSKKDKINQKINYLKFWLGICMALIISCGGWLISNIQNIKNLKFLIGVAFIIYIIILAIKFHKKIEKLMDELEDL